MEIFTTVFYRHHATGRRAVGARRMAPLMQAMFSTNSLCSSGDRDDFNINCIGHASGGLDRDRSRLAIWAKPYQPHRQLLSKAGHACR